MKYSKKTVALSMAVLMAIGLTGCGNQIPDMTEEQSRLITEYTAGLLLKYDASYKSRLVDNVDEAAQLSEAEQNQEEQQQEDAQTVSDADIENTDAAQSGENDAEDTTVSAELTLAQVLGMDSVQITYDGYQICDSYPEASSDPEELFFAMTAGTGEKLLVLDLTVTNISGETVLFDTMTDTDIKCKAIVNGSEEHSVYVSMVDNDFLAISQELAAGESLQAVLVTELSEEDAQAIESVSLYVRNGEQKTEVEPGQQNVTTGQEMTEQTAEEQAEEEQKATEEQQVQETDNVQ
jgi:hypothetical protein